MATKKINARIQIKGDTTANWKKATSFTPKANELIYFTDTHVLKVGNGSSTVANIPSIRLDDGVLS